MQISNNVPPKILHGNTNLLNETLGAIFFEIIPKNKQIDSVVQAFKVKNYQKQKLNPQFQRTILDFVSVLMSKRLENLEMRQDKFLELLEVFVNENWKDLATYDSFG